MSKFPLWEDNKTEVLLYLSVLSIERVDDNISSNINVSFRWPKSNKMNQGFGMDNFLLLML